MKKQRGSLKYACVTKEGISHERTERGLKHACGRKEGMTREGKGIQDPIELIAVRHAKCEILSILNAG